MVIYITKWLTMTAPALGFPNIRKGSVAIKILSKSSFVTRVCYEIMIAILVTVLMTLTLLVCHKTLIKFSGFL